MQVRVCCALLYCRALKAAGFEVSVRPLFTNQYLRELYRDKRKSSISVIACYFRRFLDLRHSVDFDLIWVEKELFPYLPAWFEARLLSARTPYVVDYDDAVFHNCDMHSSTIVRKILERKFEPLLRGASVIMAGNRYLAEWAIASGARHVEIIPTVVDLAHYPHMPKPDNPNNKELRVIWIGSPSTSKYLEIIREPLQAAAALHHLHCVTIGADKLNNWPIPLKQLPWDERLESQMIGSCDVGIMPLQHGPWELGKCGYKLIQYMACGLPVIASPVGANVDIVNNSGGGFLASSMPEWMDAFDRLAGDSALRRRMGTNGRRAVEIHYSLHSTAPRVVALLRDAISLRA